MNSLAKIFGEKLHGSNCFTTFAVSLPETLITAIPDMPGPVDNAYIVIL